MELCWLAFNFNQALFCRLGHNFLKQWEQWQLYCVVLLIAFLYALTSIIAELVLVNFNCSGYPGIVALIQSWSRHQVIMLLRDSCTVISYSVRVAAVDASCALVLLQVVVAPSIVNPSVSSSIALRGLKLWWLSALTVPAYVSDAGCYWSCCGILEVIVVLRSAIRLYCRAPWFFLFFLQ